MINVRIFSTKASAGAIALSKYIRELGIRSTKVGFVSKEFIPNFNDLFINWGSSKWPKWIIRKDIIKYSGILNYPEMVEVAINKLATFQTLEQVGVCIPGYATRPEEVIASGWGNIVGREGVDGSAGRGIILMNTSNPNPIWDRPCPLYTQYIKKTKEYRVHVFKEKVIDVQEKRRDSAVEIINFKIRTHANGWVFCREDVDPPSQVLEEALAAVDALNLDFGAVDIIWNRHHKKAYVLEVNTAPGLEGTTVEIYGNAILRHLETL